MATVMPDLEALRQAIAESPRNLPLLRLFAKSCVAEYCFAEAREAYERVLSLQPNALDARLGMARIHFVEGRLSEAMVRVEDVLKEFPDSAEALVLMSRLHLAEGSATTARDFYQRAMALNRDAADPPLERELSQVRAEGIRESNHKTLKQGLPSMDPWGDEEDEWNFGGDEEFDDEVDDPAYFERKLNLDDFVRPSRSFADVAGMRAIKDAIRKRFIIPAMKPEICRPYGREAGGRFLLYGPPGCGKTLVAQATAGEFDAGYFGIDVHQILDRYPGGSERNLHQVFELARQNAPAVIFFDEIDALAGDRSGRQSGVPTALVSQFLMEIDGTHPDNQGLLIIGATNAPWTLDRSFRRPGRFDWEFFVPPPDEPDRMAIVKLLARNKPKAALDIKHIASRTERFSGADLEAMFDRAVDRALSRSAREGRIVPLTTESLLTAARTLTPSASSWFDEVKKREAQDQNCSFYREVRRFLKESRV